MTTAEDSSGADMKTIKVPVQIDPAIAEDLRRYARFRNLKPSSIISAEVAQMLAAYRLADLRLEHVMARDKSFQRWKKNRGGASTVLRTGKMMTLHPFQGHAKPQKGLHR
jgi:hypothetical protein